MGCHNSFRARAPARARTASHSFVVETVHGQTVFGVRARAREDIASEGLLFANIQ
jgi:hypothetical protein